MVRTARFAAEDFVGAAVTLIADGGAGSATMAAIARKVGAPTGSIYHRFDSRAAVVARGWLEIHGSFRDACGMALRGGDLAGAAHGVLAWARVHPTWARFLLLNDAPALLDGIDDATRREVDAAQSILDSDFAECLKGLARHGHKGQAVAARAKFLAFDGLVALMQPYLLAREQVPAHVDATVESLTAALFDGTKAARDAA